MPKDFEKNLKEEIWGCFKHIGIPIDTIMKMTVMDRKFFIMMHNKTESERENSMNNDDMTMSAVEKDRFEMMNRAREFYQE